MFSKWLHAMCKYWVRIELRSYFLHRVRGSSSHKGWWGVFQNLFTWIRSARKSRQTFVYSERRKEKKRKIEKLLPGGEFELRQILFPSPFEQFVAKITFFVKDIGCCGITSLTANFPAKFRSPSTFPRRFPKRRFSVLFVKIKIKKKEKERKKKKLRQERGRWKLVVDASVPRSP